MKKSKLLFLSLLAVGAISLVSCGQGAKGDKGDPGTTGQKGDTGSPGEDGKNGEDGSTLLSGEGIPSSALGNDGDTYVDTKNLEYYVKENGIWIKKGSYKGDTGNTGTSGSDAKTTYSNTILYSDLGTVYPDKGSAVVGEYIAFTIVPDSSYYVFKSITLNEKTYTTASKEISFNNITGYYELKVPMVEGGFIVTVEFGESKDQDAPVETHGPVTEAEWKAAFSLDNLNVNVTKKYYDINSLRTYSYSREKNDDVNYIKIKKTTSKESIESIETYFDVYKKDSEEYIRYIDNKDETWTKYKESSYWDGMNCSDRDDDYQTKQENYFNSFKYYCPDFSDYYGLFEYSKEDQTYYFKAENYNDYIETYGGKNSFNNEVHYNKVALKFDENKKISSIKYNPLKMYESKNYDSTLVIEFNDYGLVDLSEPSGDLLHEHQYEYIQYTNGHDKSATCKHDYDFENNEYENHVWDDENNPTRCTVCGYIKGQEESNKISKKTWEKCFNYIRSLNYDYRNSITLSFNDKTWSFNRDGVNENGVGYKVSSLNLNGDKRNYFFDIDDNNFEVIGKFFNGNSVDGKWEFMDKETYNKDNLKEENNWDYNYAFSYLAVCPDFTDYYDKFTFDEESDTFNFVGNKDNDVIEANKLANMENSYKIIDNKYEYDKTASYYNIAVKFNGNTLSSITFNSTDDNLGSNQITVKFSYEYFSAFPKHNHVYEDTWTPGMRSTYNSETQVNEYTYGHYHKSKCFDGNYETIDGKNYTYKDFAPHNYNDKGICKDCGFNSHKLKDNYAWYSVFNNSSNYLSAEVKWADKTLIYKSIISKTDESYTIKLLIEYGSEKWIIIRSYDYNNYSSDEETNKVLVYKSIDNGISWEKTYDGYFYQFIGEEYSSYRKYLFSREFIVPNLNDRYEAYESYFEYKDGQYKSKNLSYDNRIIRNNLLLDKYDNNAYFGYGIYYNVSINFGIEDKIGFVLKSMSFNVTDNKLFGSNLVTVTYDYGSFEINEPSE